MLPELQVTAGTTHDPITSATEPLGAVTAYPLQLVLVPFAARILGTDPGDEALAAAGSAMLTAPRTMRMETAREAATGANPFDNWPRAVCAI